MKYGEYKEEVKEMLLDAGEIFGTEKYLERHMRVALLEALSFFPSLRPISTLRVTSHDVIPEGLSSVFSIPFGFDITGVEIIPSGWVYASEEVTATTDGSGNITSSLSDGDAFVITDPSRTGWEVETLHYAKLIGSMKVVLHPDSTPLVESDPLGSTIKYRKVVQEEYNSTHTLGPFTRIAWDQRKRLINGVVNVTDIYFTVSPDHSIMLVHPQINFERILEVSHRTQGTKFEDEHIINIPEGIEDRFIVACSDYIRAKVAKDVDRNPGLADMNNRDFKKQLRSIFKEIPR